MITSSDAQIENSYMSGNKNKRGEHKMVGDTNMEFAPEIRVETVAKE